MATANAECRPREMANVVPFRPARVSGPCMTRLWKRIGEKRPAP